MEKNKRSCTKLIFILVIIIAILFLVLNINVHLIDINPKEIELYGPPLQLFGIDYSYQDHDVDENIPEDVMKIYVPIKDYFRAQDAIDRSHALMGIIYDCLYSFADNLNLGSNS